MMSGMSLLVICLSVVLGSGCAHAMGGRRSCSDPVIPSRPDYEQCVADGNGKALCYDPRRNPAQYSRPIQVDDIIVNISDYNAQDLWMSDVLRACRQ